MDKTTETNRNIIVVLNNINAETFNSATSEDVEIQIFDEIIASPTSNGTRIFTCFKRILSSNPERVKITVSFNAYCDTDEQSRGLSGTDLMNYLQNDGYVISHCASKASLLLSQVTSMMFEGTPIITPPNFLSK